jgi:hypothetical protein
MTYADFTALKVRIDQHIAWVTLDHPPINLLELRGDAARRPIWIGLSVATFAVWLVATILSITLPVVETGSDPTRLPIAAMVTPIAAALLTALAGIIAGVFSRPPQAG